MIQGDFRFGGFLTTGPARLAAAIVAFGEPNPTTELAGRRCVARWRDLGLRITFYVIDRRRDACEPEDACFWSAVMTGPMWRTEKAFA